ncbi:lysophospholipase L1-like esterase [Mucilaginibacter yixingensis]|uniref:Lysophospholipase L1-like esterase n=1 Tax=Mucilaginibacter yixingensis TaxID=1295612 RepID=A0A2T5JCD6_9SPHI|nr:SGNH/GDSL hydrolase family protein [Mucilaginibacter yixingensis]PTQ99424.1 lysophospholipase L1-like esterase [Mucilaginibacter yixingensis]
MKAAIIILLSAAGMLACASKKTTTQQETGVASQASPTTDMPASTQTWNYLALGDSYTIGEAVPQEQSFPYQLCAALSKNGHPTAAPTIIARTGWTTDELIAAIKQQNITRKFDFVTLLIGVNNQYRGYDISTYTKEFTELLGTAINYAGGNAKHVFVISIPDWGVTPYADGRDRATIGKEIDAYNTINRQESLKAGVNYCNITPVSRQVPGNPSLVAEDGLHPSGEMYRLWVEPLEPIVRSVVGH